MEQILNQRRKSRENMGAIFIIAFASMFILANFFVGFSLPIYLVFIFVAFLIASSYPRSGFFAIIFLTFIFERFFTLAPIVLGKAEYKMYPLDLLMLATIIGIGVSWLKGEIKIKFEKTDLFVALFMVAAFMYGIASVFFLGGDGALSFSSAKNYVFYAILYFAALALIRTKEDFVQLAKFVVAGGIGIIGFLVYGIANGEGLWSQYTPLSTEGIRILAFTHAFYLSMVLVFALVYVFSESKNVFFRKTLHVLMPFWTVGIIGSMMRHLWISFAAAMLLVVGIIGKRLFKNAGQAIAGYVIFVFFIAALVFYASSMLPNSRFNESVSSIFGTVGNRVISIADSSDESIFWRNVVWKEAFKKYAENPVLGTGFGKYVSVEIGSYREFVEIRNIHNSFLIIVVQMGILGAILFVLPVISLVKRMIASIKKEDGLRVARITVAGILALHLVAFIFQPYLEANLLGIFFWINLGLMRSLNEEKESI